MLLFDIHLRFWREGIIYTESNEVKIYISAIICAYITGNISARSCYRRSINHEVRNENAMNQSMYEEAKY